jgi:hypothetical protein
MGVKRTWVPHGAMSAFDPMRISGSQACCVAIGHFREAGLTRYDASSVVEGKAMTRHSGHVLL